MKPPCTITSRVLSLVSEISLLLGRYEGLHSPPPEPKLRKQNRIKTIRGSLQIEGNTLTEEQITAILENKHVLGPRLEIKEVQNAIKTYSELKNFSPYSLKSFLKAHAYLMNGILEDEGKFRSGNVGILKGTKVSHLAPKPHMVPELMEKLFNYLKSEKAEHFLIKSSIAHYEIEFIHPFSDGNGRMGRLWQTIILTSYNPIFEYLPIESSIKNHQQEYYDALEKSDKSGDSSSFVEFILEMILETLKEFLDSIRPIKLTPKDRLEKSKEYFQRKEFSRKDYLEYFKEISAPTASRDLLWGTEQKILKKSGSKNQTVYLFLA